MLGLIQDVEKSLASAFAGSCGFLLVGRTVQPDTQTYMRHPVASAACLTLSLLGVHSDYIDVVCV
uniref:Uncharacterized protein n=1 Tax=Peronospora matthiolae TaxID=2874970 RepID=A0AAV1V2D0_9STRA